MRASGNGVGDDGGGWRDFGGDELEQSLTVLPECAEAPIRLIDARYLVEQGKKGRRLLRRQDLPAGAFLSLDQIKTLGWFKSTALSRSLRIVTVSHPWLQPDHPDPKEVNLQLLAKVMKLMLEYFKRFGTGTFAVFFE